MLLENEPWYLLVHMKLAGYSVLEAAQMVHDVPGCLPPSYEGVLMDCWEAGMTETVFRCSAPGGVQKESALRREGQRCRC